MKNSPESASGKNSRGGVTVHIERLVIDGFPLSAVQVAQLQRSLLRELTLLLQADGLASLSGGAMPSLIAPLVQIPPSYQPADLGRQIARSVHESLTRSSL
jgi:hypothetical protein